MCLQVLVATMNQNDHSLLDKMNIQSDAIIINQCNENFAKSIKNDNFHIKWVNSDERGLSRSRNMALKKATGDICILADDDLEYVANYNDIILDQFKLYPDADIIAFQVEGIESIFKNYYPKQRKTGFLNSMKISSVEIAFRLDKIKSAGVQFNELFGAGAKYCMSEENIFLAECLKKGLTINYVPLKIANLHIGKSTWFNGYNRDYFISRGAAFTAMSNFFSILFIVQFSIRKYNLFSNELTRFQAIKLMIEGRNKFLKEKGDRN